MLFSLDSIYHLDFKNAFRVALDDLSQLGVKYNLTALIFCYFCPRFGGEAP